MIIGAVLAAFATRWAATLLYELKPWDTASFALAAGGLGVVTCLRLGCPPDGRCAFHRPSR
jgi:hypothetical protein